MDKKLVSHSRFISLVLRHRPQTISLELDDSGWADVDKLICQMNRHGRRIDVNTLQQIVEQNDKKRFTLSEDGQRIRANQGHSIAVDLELVQVSPPGELYHGTAVSVLPKIREQGLIKMNRQHVHLSQDRQTARQVGSRHGPPVVLTVRAAMMHHEGFVFYRSENGVWLTDYVPYRYLFE